MSEAMVQYGNCFTEHEDLYTKAGLRFDCSLIYKLNKMIFFSLFHMKFDIQGQ